MTQKKRPSRKTKAPAFSTPPAKRLSKSPSKPRFHLRQGEVIGKGLKSIVKIQLEAALADLKGNNCSPKAIHNTRTTIKKVRSIIELTASSFARDQRHELTKMLREASLRIAPIRDAGVLLDTFDLLLQKNELPQQHFATLRDGLVDSERQLRSNGARQIPHVIKLLKQVHRSIPKWGLEALSGKDLRRGIRHTYRRGRKALELCSATGDEKHFHTWRKLVKQLCYQLRVTSCYWPDQAREQIGETDAIGENAGNQRDLTLFAHWIRKGPKTSAAEALQIAASSLMQPLHKKAILAGEDFYKNKSKTFVASLEM